LALAWSPDGRYIASGSGDEKSLQIWRARTGKCLWSTLNSTASIDALVWSPDGSLLAGGNENGVIKIWQTQTGKKLLTYEGHVIDESGDGFHGVSELVWSPDGTQIASVARDRTLQVWNATTGQVILTIPFASASVVWSPDGTRLVGNTKGKDGKYRVVVWDSKNGLPLFTHRYWSSPGPFSYSPDGTRLAIGHSNGKIRIVEEVH
jgi:eukaryotic-like serine/threonine-protein kinase